MTRAQTYDATAVVSQIKGFLHAHSQIHGFEAKLKNCRNLFAFLALHRGFVLDHKTFGDTIMFKFGEFLIANGEDPRVDLMVRKAARDIFCMSKNQVIGRICELHHEYKTNGKLCVLTDHKVNVLRRLMD